MPPSKAKKDGRAAKDARKAAPASKPSADESEEEHPRYTQRSEAEEDEEEPAAGEESSAAGEAASAGDAAAALPPQSSTPSKKAAAAAAAVLVPELPSRYALPSSVVPPSPSANNAAKLAFQLEVSAHLEATVRGMHKNLQALESQVPVPPRHTRSSPPSSKHSKAAKQRKQREEAADDWPPFKDDGYPDGAREPWREILSKAGESVLIVTCMC